MPLRWLRTTNGSNSIHDPSQSLLRPHSIYTPVALLPLTSMITSLPCFTVAGAVAATEHIQRP
jgi:hypothetical protein